MIDFKKLATEVNHPVLAPRLDDMLDAATSELRAEGEVATGRRLVTVVIRVAGSRPLYFATGQIDSDFNENGFLRMQFNNYLMNLAEADEDVETRIGDVLRMTPALEIVTERSGALIAGSERAGRAIHARGHRAWTAQEDGVQIALTGPEDSFDELATQWV